mgnify:FL=1
MTTINLHCKCLTIDKKCYKRRNEISNIVYTNPLTISGSEGIFWCGYSRSPIYLLSLRCCSQCVNKATRQPLLTVVMMFTSISNIIVYTSSLRQFRRLRDRRLHYYIILYTASKCIFMVNCTF